MFIVGVSIWGAAPTVLATDATPVPAMGCDVAPRPASAYASIKPTMVSATGTTSTVAGSPTPTPIGPEAIPTIGAVRPGWPTVDAATALAVRSTAAEFVACANAGDRPRLFALFTVRWVTATLASSKLSVDDMLMPSEQATPLSSMDRSVLIDVQTPYGTADGGVSATIVIARESAPQGPLFHLQALFLFEEGKYLIDKIEQINLQDDANGLIHDRDSLMHPVRLGPGGRPGDAARRWRRQPRPLTPILPLFLKGPFWGTG